MAMINLYRANVIGIKWNCLYPNHVEVTDEKSLLSAVGRDYVCAEYKGNYRSKDNFISSDCLPVDCDNDHSENPADWITPDDVAQAFPNVTFFVHYSQHHNRVKENKSARPRFHILFPIERMTDHAAYANLKTVVNGIFPYFDTNALDAARFFYGTSDPKIELHKGFMNLTEFLQDAAPFDQDLNQGQYGNRVIQEGNRNNTMSQYAGKIIKKFGDTEKAYQCFLEEAAKCSPPLPDDELQTIWHSAQRFFVGVQKQEGYVDPDTYNTEVSYKPEDYSDVGQAEVLAKYFACELRYSPATHYIRYVDNHWKETESGAQAVAHELTRRQLEEANVEIMKALVHMDECGAQEILDTASSKKKAASLMNDEQTEALEALNAANTYRAFTMRCRESKNVTAVLKEARPKLEISPNELDSDPYVLCTPTATYDLRKGLKGAREHSPDDFITKMTAVSPGNKGEKLWNDALNLFFCRDRVLIEYVQINCGIAIIGMVLVEALFIALGIGRNGKSTFWNVIAMVLGSYSGNISADALTTGCHRNIKPELAETKGKRLLIASEMQEGARLNDSVVKQLCSTDKIFAEKKYKDPFSFNPCHTLVLYTNHLPRVSASDDGIWRRLIVIPFNAKIEGEGDRKNYAKFLFENAGEAILAWLIEGARKAIELDFKVPVPPCVRQAIEAYREQNNWFGHFLEDKCEVGDSFTESSSELYQTYRGYCAEMGEYTRSTTDFYAALDRAGFERITIKRKRCYKGLKLRVGDDFLS